ncbi:10788_t:CDS:1 [Racocetra fulgida]|uniref:10788_t:CDS:1 n=1 Tax=Racocetra fulgida TaxID=60492 RepID=A0A9N9CXF9_9GLOM|nr:10788_t:CDS:1 [Racocetra fulgida]
MSQQNIQQTCSVCLENIIIFKNITNDFIYKINNCPDKEFYQGLKPGIDKLCSSCYNKIADSYQRQISTINRVRRFDNLISINETNTSIDLVEIDEFNTSTSDKNNRSNSPITLIETNNLVNLIELIEIQKKELTENDLIEINQQFVDVKVDIIDNIISMDKKNFNQLIKLIIQKDLKIETLTN